MARPATMATCLRGRALTTFLAAVTQEGGDDEVKELRRRVSRPLPRRVRKDLERIAQESPFDPARDGAAWAADEQRNADRLALLLSRDPSAALESMGLRRGQRDLAGNARAVELVRWLAGETAWRAYLRLSA
jgi:hypothetical protein